ncbi:hypothetical protein QFC20_002732 [Naganishia adeliensis]|uniref:Uncharacterized protein n=1 Tax=Naganishia adeliensis TaxID=92952 RepID=A0ACC2WJG5_9TREE|nr:hypothetical protein QFC20_002732 [Naganishia adeliensis]
MEYRPFHSEEHDLPDIINLVDQELTNHPPFYVLAKVYPPPPQPTSTTDERPHAIACIVCKQDTHKSRVNRGYIAMLSVDRAWRRRGIARKLIELAVGTMISRGADEIVLETEHDNAASLSLYGSMGFIKDRRLHRFYLNGKDAFRLVYPVSKETSTTSGDPPTSSPPDLLNTSDSELRLQHAPLSPDLQISGLSIPDSEPPVLPLRPAPNGTVTNGAGSNGTGLLGTVREERKHGENEEDEEIGEQEENGQAVTRLSL